MDHTRSGRKVKRSSKFIDMEEDFNQFEMGNASGDDGDYNIDDDNSSECSGYDMNGYDEEVYTAPRQSTRVINKQITTDGLAWKNGKLVPLEEPMMSILPLKKQKSSSNDEVVPRITVVKDDPATRFYSSAIDALKSSNISYPSIVNKVSDDISQTNLPLIDLINDERFHVPLEPRSPGLVPRYDKSTAKISELVGVPLDVEDLKRYSRLTGHILLSIVNKRRMIEGGSARQQEPQWAAMPERTRRDWEIKAKQIKKLVDNKRRNDLLEDGSKREKRRLALKKAEDNIKKAKLADHSLSDLAFYLKAVGDGMSKLSSKLAGLKGTVVEDGVESVMLDYLLCSFVCLAGIFAESEGLDGSATTDSLNRLTFVVPGLLLPN